MMSLGKMVRECQATQVVFCQDLKPYFRSLEYPEYKQLRKKTQDPELLKAFQQSKVLVLEVLEALGAPIWGLPGFEVDDLIAHAATKYRHRYSSIIAGSNDSDLYQLLRFDNFQIYTSGLDSLATPRKTLDALGLTSEQYMLVTALTGTHNDLAGISGCGPKTAAKAIRDPALMRLFRSEHGDLIDRNLRLIRLPHREFPRQETIPVWSRSFAPRELYRLLGKYDIDVTGSMVRAFEQTWVKK